MLSFCCVDLTTVFHSANQHFKADHGYVCFGLCMQFELSCWTDDVLGKCKTAPLSPPACRFASASAGSYGFVNYSHHDEAVHAIVSMNGQTIGSKPLKCAWGRHQPRQTPVPPLQLLQMQHQMQNELGLLGAQGMLSTMRPIIQMPGAMQVPSQLPHVGVPQLLPPQHAQQALQQQVVLNSIFPWGHI